MPSIRPRFQHLTSALLSLGLLAACGGRDYDLLVLQTNDSHSHWLGLPNAAYAPATTGDGTTGGAARWAKLVAERRAAVEDSLFLSAGDFTMGTLLVVGHGTAADLDLMKAVGYDAAALGNHELDWGPAGLAAMIQAAAKPTIPLLCANIRFSDSDPADDSLAALYGQEGEAGKFIYPYIVRKLPSGLKVGIFGLMGIEAASVSNAAPLRFSADLSALAATAQDVVDILRDEEDVDVVIALAHLGLALDGGQPIGETAELARRTTGIDLILSGHWHTAVTAPVAIASTKKDADWTAWALEAGAYGQYVGRYRLQRSGGERSASGELLAIDDQLPADPAVTALVDALVADVEDNFLADYPLLPEAGAFLTGDLLQQLTTADFDLQRHYFEPNNLGYLTADAVREDCGAQLVAISNGGDLRESLPRVSGGFSVADTFIATPLGIGPDGKVGYPIVKFHINLLQLKLVLESTIADQGLVNNDYMLSTSGLRIELDTSRPAQGRITRLTLYDAEDESDAGSDIFNLAGGGFAASPYTLVSICTTSYIAGFLRSYNINWLDAAGQPIADLADVIVRDADQREVKLWYSLQRKLASFGAGGVPDLYNDDQLANPAGPYWRRAWDVARHPR